jgi:hypothetical protein
LTVAALILVLFLILLLYPKYDQVRNANAYRQLVQTVNDGKDGPVLLINERQLVTFGDAVYPYRTIMKQ